MATLHILGHDDEPVPHRFSRQDRETPHLALVLPGLGYTCDMPLLYYTARQLRDLGADVLQVDYDYRRPASRALSDDEQTGRLLADATAAWRAGRAERAYEQVTLVGKSLGTLALAHLLAHERGGGQVRAIWFTPLWHEASVREQLLGARRPALVVIGTADPAYEAATAQAVRGEILVIEGAGHSLDIPGEVVRSVQALERVVRAVHAFLAR